MARILYLAEIQRVISVYMGSSRTEVLTRLVWASSPEDARQKINVRFGEGASRAYDTTYEILSCSLSEAIE